MLKCDLKLSGLTWKYHILKREKARKTLKNKKNPAISMTAGFAKYGPNGDTELFEKHSNINGF